MAKRPDHLDFLLRIADKVPSMLAYWDTDLCCRYANRAYRDWFGIDPEAVIGRRLPDLLGPALYALNEPHVRAALAGVEQRFERDMPGPSGMRRSLAHYLPDVVDGVVQGFVAHVADVTPLKAAQSRLAEAQRLAHVGSWEWRPQTGALSWSSELFRIFGMDPDSPPPPYEQQDAIYLPASWQHLRRAVSAALADGTPYELELEFRRADGSVGWIEARGEAMRDAAGRITGLRGTGHDITLRRSLEAERVRAQVAESASRNKTELLSRASHELRTPLNAILGFGQLLQQQPDLSAQSRQRVDYIVDSGRLMLALTEDLLDLAAAESGGLSFSLEDVDLSAVADYARALLESAAGQARMRIVLEPGPFGFVRADGLRARQIAANLMSNAIKYGRHATVVRVWADAGPDGSRRLHVEDQGPGLTDAQLSQLFKPFERLGAERTSVPGVGLGLALSQQLAQLMGGRIEVRSRPGAGSRFTLVLPAAPAPGDAG